MSTTHTIHYECPATGGVVTEAYNMFASGCEPGLVADCWWRDHTAELRVSATDSASCPVAETLGCGLDLVVVSPTGHRSAHHVHTVVRVERQDSDRWYNHPGAALHALLDDVAAS